MLVYFSVENWKAFKEPSALSMRATRERFSNDTCAKLSAKYGGMRLLPTAALFGPNASGKTCFFDALSFIQHLVLEGTPVNHLTGVDPFRLDTSCQNEPSNFVLEALVDDLIYEYKLSLKSDCVVNEILTIKRTRGSQLVFSRHHNKFEFGNGFDSSRHQLIAENTRSNDLFLHNSITQNAHAFAPLYDWFANSLVVLGTFPQYNRYSTMLLRSDFVKFVSTRLKNYETGISQIVTVDVPLSGIPVTPDVIDNVVASAPAGDDVFIQLRINFEDSRGCEIYIIEVPPQGDIVASKLKFRHVTRDGRQVDFDLRDESQGTQRLIELLPLFFDLANLENECAGSERVYVIDEIDTSFHTALTASLLRDYLTCRTSDSRQQLIFSTHDLLLMDENLLRKDEMWISAKDDAGCASITCLGKHANVRSDTDLLKSYREGKFGNYPTYPNL